MWYNQPISYHTVHQSTEYVNRTNLVELFFDRTQLQEQFLKTISVSTKVLTYFTLEITC